MQRSHNLTERPTAAFVGKSAEAIGRILSLFPEVHTILDPTYGLGAFYRGLVGIEVTGGDNNPERAKDVVLDFRHLPFPERSFDAVILDPPYQQGASTTDYARQYGCNSLSIEKLVEDYVVGIGEGQRVARHLVVAKCADAISSGRFWPVASLIIQRVGPPFDVLITVNPNPRAGPMWRTVQHFRHNYAYYLLWRTGGTR